MSNRGGKRPGAGRPKGSGNKASKLDRENLILEARSYGHIALETLKDIAQNSKSDAARISAAVQLLDRAFGKPGVMPDMRTAEEKDPENLEGQDEFEELWKQALNQPAPDIVSTNKPAGEGPGTVMSHGEVSMSVQN